MHLVLSLKLCGNDLCGLRVPVRDGSKKTKSLKNICKEILDHYVSDYNQAAILEHRKNCLLILLNSDALREIPKIAKSKISISSKRILWSFFYLICCNFY
ncbi:hypothetical protein GCK32_021093 [Trichostrongylus colubriformis]|uniref:Uncharacterized protein n=1 Tax=Trichostrongylus colubriformis TaxID=6319 RepID=A0AAN8F401_TRICO